jgi:hypothetical protein
MPNVAFELRPDSDVIGLNFPSRISEGGLMKAVIRGFGLEEVTDVVHFYDTKGATMDVLSIASLSDGDSILVVVPESQDPYKGMSRTEKRNAISGKPFEGVEVTMAPDSIRSQLNTLQQTANNKLASTYPATTSLNIIDENWGTDMSVFPPVPWGYPDKRTFRTAGDASTWGLRLRLLATLAILSECTPGQAEHIGPMLNAAVELRNIDKRVKKNKFIMTDNDVVTVIKNLVHPLEGKKKDILDPRKRKIEYDSRRKTEAKNKKATEQALDADMPVGGKGMQQVEKKMKKSTMKEYEVVESDSEDEDMDEADGKQMG